MGCIARSVEAEAIVSVVDTKIPAPVVQVSGKTKVRVRQQHIPVATISPMTDTMVRVLDVAPGSVVAAGILRSESNIFFRRVGLDSGAGVSVRCGAELRSIDLTIRLWSSHKILQRARTRAYKHKIELVTSFTYTFT